MKKITSIYILFITLGIFLFFSNDVKAFGTVVSSSTDPILQRTMTMDSGSLYTVGAVSNSYYSGCLNHAFADCILVQRFDHNLNPIGNFLWDHGYRARHSFTPFVGVNANHLYITGFMELEGGVDTSGFFIKKVSKSDPTVVLDHDEYLLADSGGLNMGYHPEDFYVEGSTILAVVNRGSASLPQHTRLLKINPTDGSFIEHDITSHGWSEIDVINDDSFGYSHLASDTSNVYMLVRSGANVLLARFDINTLALVDTVVVDDWSERYSASVKNFGGQIYVKYLDDQYSPGTGYYYAGYGSTFNLKVFNNDLSLFSSIQENHNDLGLVLTDPSYGATLVDFSQADEVYMLIKSTTDSWFMRYDTYVDGLDRGVGVLHDEQAYNYYYQPKDYQDSEFYGDYIYLLNHTAGVIEKMEITYPDTTNPTISITNPSTDPYSASGNPITISGTASDNIGVISVTWQNTTSGDSGPATGISNWSADIPLLSGSNNIVITAQDGVGNSATDSVVVNYDPCSWQSIPTQTWSGYLCDDPPPAKSSCNLSNDGLFWGHDDWLTCDEYGLEFSGSDTWWADEKCVCGSVGDVTQPTIAITTPNTDPYPTINTPISVSGTASDNISLNSVSWQNITTGATGTASGLGSWSVNNINLNTGDNILIVTALDSSGNFSNDSITVQYNPDISPPSVTILTPSTDGSFTTNQASIDITGTSSDDTILTMEWSNDNWVSTNPVSQTPTTPNNYSWSISALPLNYGSNNIQIKATDSASNETIEAINITRLPPGGELMGYAWTETIGWISMSSRNNTSGPIYYGVVIDQVTGHLSGYGWSENVGWISFEETDPTPDNNTFSSNCMNTNCSTGSSCTACYNPNPVDEPLGTGKLYGWGRVISLGDDGWIRLDDDNQVDSIDYGITYDVANSEFHGYAWNGNVGQPESAGIGWLSYNCQNYSSCVSSGYKVVGYLNMAPSVTFSTDPALSFPCQSPTACVSDCETRPVIGWVFSEPEGLEQAYYHFVLENNDTSTTLIDTGKTAGNKDRIDVYGEYGLTLNYNTNYTAQIRVWDQSGEESGWITNSTTTHDHQFPEPYFDWFSREGSAGEQILFSDETIFYNDSNSASSPGFCYTSPDYPSGCSYLWSSPDASNISSPNSATTTASFPEDETGQVMNLITTDGDGYACSTSTTLYLNKRLPEWIEVR